MDSKNIKKEYSNGEVTIIWQSGLCIHSAKCWRGPQGLPQVFNPQEKPWIKPEGASSEQIIAQIKKCPSGALSYRMNNFSEDKIEHPPETLIEVTKNGPLLVHGTISLKDKQGHHSQKNKVTALCRCGASANKPFCDGSHRKIDFKDE